MQAPNISANKLGEYIFATPGKKRSIIKTIKKPSTFKSGRYPEPQSALRNFMIDTEHDKQIFETKRNQVSAKIVTTDWAKGNKACCLEALDHLSVCSETLLIPYLKFVAERKLSKIEYERNLEGVLIHLKPEIVMLDKKTRDVKGFIKSIFSKSRIIDLQEGSAIASAIKAQVEKVYGKKLDSQNCIALDVFHRRKFIAPDTNTIYEIQIKNACKEIAALWPTIEN